MTSFDYRKVFGVTGNVPGMTNGFREFTGGGQPTPGKSIGIWGVTPALSGLVGQPTNPLCAKREKIKGKKKKEEVGRGKDSLPPNQVGLGLGGESPPPWLGRLLGGPWTPRQGPPLPPPIYMEQLGLI